VKGEKERVVKRCYRGKKEKEGKKKKRKKIVGSLL